MFESCTTITALNKERAELYTSNTSNISITEINNAYNARKKEILSSVVCDYKELEVFTPVQKLFPNASSAMYKGKASSPNYIVINEEGLYV